MGAARRQRRYRKNSQGLLMSPTAASSLNGRTTVIATGGICCGCRAGRGRQAQKAPPARAAGRRAGTVTIPDKMVNGAKVRIPTSSGAGGGRWRRPFSRRLWLQQGAAVRPVACGRQRKPAQVKFTIKGKYIGEKLLTCLEKNRPPSRKRIPDIGTFHGDPSVFNRAGRSFATSERCTYE